MESPKANTSNGKEAAVNNVKSPTRKSLFITIAFTLVMIEAASHPLRIFPLGYSGIFFAMFWQLFVLFAVVTFLLIPMIESVVYLWRDENVSGKWVVFPLSLGVVVVSVVSQWPMDLRFSLSKSAFEDLRLSVLAECAPLSPKDEWEELRAQSTHYVDINRWVGLYYVWDVSANPQSDWFNVTTDVVWWTTGGFRYSEERKTKKYEVVPHWSPWVFSK